MQVLIFDSYFKFYLHCLYITFLQQIVINILVSPFFADERNNILVHHMHALSKEVEHMYK